MKKPGNLKLILLSTNTARFLDLQNLKTKKKVLLKRTVLEPLTKGKFSLKIFENICNYIWSTSKYQVSMES